jgi:CHAT domain-containing protein
LALLPFEALVVKPGPRVQYLLDVGPPIQYGPSTTVLYNLAERTPGVEDSQREPILSVGNPDYSGGGPIPARPDDVLSQVAVSARYGASGGKLAALPFTAWESAWVAESFQQAGVKTKRLEGAAATKAKLWEELAGGRRIVHLACHGLAEQSYGNLFGALALAPGKAGSADDGFLTLREIYQLNLKGCELAILSACETNCGPQQQGEGVWALSRGFLVAGARRVVASNWLVDDEAGATLVSYFCGALAQAQKQGQTADYAEALQRAKRSLRQESKWRSPYYWASLVLVGPN